MILALLLACDPDGADSLTPEAVTDIAPGDATGTAWSGTYSAEIYTESCEGLCGPIEYGYFMLTFCDVGDRDYESLTLTQTDGRLLIDLSDPISRYDGAVYADGGVDVGGYATDYGGAVEMTARVEGTLSADGLTATARSRVWGLIGEEPIDCHGTHSVQAR